MISWLRLLSTPHRPSDFAAAVWPGRSRAVTAAPVSTTAGPPVSGSPATEPAAGPATEPGVVFARSALRVPAEADRSLLEVAEAAGLEPRYGCRRGICRACTTPLLAGAVRDLHDGRRTTAGLHVRLCVSAADPSADPAADPTVGPGVDVVIDL